MTSLSEAPAPISAATAKAAPAKRGGVDYSKFDSIVDSDDEKPAEKTSAKAATPEKPHCGNCHKDIDGKVLRCGTCKKVSYCSAKCQKEDWSFHKRVCKKPEEPKAKDESKEKARAREDKENRKKVKEEKVVDDGEGDEKLTWYRHREWKPAEAKKEFTPQAITGEVAGAAVADTAAPAAGSVWNKAGTWEDKDVTEMAQSTLKDKIKAGIPDVEVAGGAISAQEEVKVEGEASRPVIRGKMRHMFDLSFKVSFVFKWMDAAGRNEAAGTLSISDFTNDSTMEEDGGPEVKVSWKDSKLETARRKAVEDAIGARVWPPSAGTLTAHVAQRMMLWSKEFQQDS